MYLAWDAKLDLLAGNCCLRQPSVSKIVSEGLHKFDGERYVMAAYAIMPNHVHLLAAFKEEGLVTKQGAQWRRFSATKINELLNRQGHVWQQDHLIILSAAKHHSIEFAGTLSTIP